MLQDIALGKAFFRYDPKTTSKMINGIIPNCTAKETDNVQNGRKYLQTTHLTKYYYSNIYRTQQKKMNNPIKNLASDLNRHFLRVHTNSQKVCKKSKPQ
jgi:hypothetical protein